jgi:hypothetical protein
LIYTSADTTKLFMGLATWKHAPHGKIQKSDVTVAKNYLSEAHVKELNRIVSAYLDLAENRAQRGILMKMNDWATFLNSFLELSSYPILADKGKVTTLEAKLKAAGEYALYRERQDADYVSDFDRAVQAAKRLEGDASPKVIGPGRTPLRREVTRSKGHEEAVMLPPRQRAPRNPAARQRSTRPAIRPRTLGNQLDRVAAAAARVQSSLCSDC